MKKINFAIISCLLIGSLSICCSNEHKSEDESKVEREIIKKSTEVFKYPEYLSKSFLQGHFLPSKHNDFVIIPDSLRSGYKMYLHKDALKAFTLMHDEISKLGLSIYIISATRNFEYQKKIWLRKWMGKTKLSGNIDAKNRYPNEVERAKKILEYSSMPGTSRHHWGTDIDINSLQNSYFESGEGLKIYNWLTEYGPNFGFCQTYTKIDSIRPNGYQEEKWHWSYTPISNVLTKAYKDSLKLSDLEGFIGSDIVDELDVIENYVLGVNPSCKNN